MSSKRSIRQLAKDNEVTASAAFLYITILVMGFIGANCRYLLEFVKFDTWFPVTTLFINIVGSFCIFVAYRYLGRRVHLSRHLVRGIGVGLVGSFTTLAAFYTEVILLVRRGLVTEAAIYGAVTVVVTFFAAVAGMYFADYLAHRRVRKLQKRRVKRSQERRHRIEADQLEAAGEMFSNDVVLRQSSVREVEQRTAQAQITPREARQAARRQKRSKPSDSTEKRGE